MGSNLAFEVRETRAKRFVYNPVMRGMIRA
jgi:hypothetical protein